MKTFVISLKRSTERRKYIVNHLSKINLDFEIFDAIDGRLLKEEDIKKYCDVEQVNKLRWWLNDGAIGCALSHYFVYKKIVEQNLDYALILEDDVVLPSDIKIWLSQIGDTIKSNEIILLYYTSFKPCYFSNIGKTDILNGRSGLYYPINPKQPVTATAYIIDREAAINMIDTILPIKVAADSWEYFYEHNGLKSFRCLWPTPFKTKNFKSSIDYIPPSSFKGRTLSIIDKYKIPLLYQYLKWLRKKRLNSMQDHFYISNEASPIYNKIQATGTL